MVLMKQRPSVRKNYEKLKIKEFTYWSVFLHENQCYLGRLVIWSHREKFVDIFDLTSAELGELVKIGRLLKRVIDDLFAPDLYNWASYANIIKHQHVHLIPRYSRNVKYFDTIFIDKRWGRNPAPYEDLVLPDALLESLRVLINSKIET